MARKRSSKKSKKSNKQNPVFTILVIVGVLCAFGVYTFTGADPLGLFDDTSPSPTSPPSFETIGADWWSVYFTNPSGGEALDQTEWTVAEHLVERINQAQRSIHIASFEFNLTPVAEALIDAHNRGVEVLWVTDDEYGLDADIEDGHGQFALLEKSGIPIRDDGRGALMHNKFWIFDGQVVWTGSTNITQNGIWRNNNNVIVIKSVRLADIYEREFQEMWAGEFGPTSPSTLDQQRIVLNDTPVQVIFAAEDEAIQQLVPLIQNAQQSIRFMAFSFTQDDLGEAVLARAEAGVDVQGIFETRGSETEFSELGRFYCADLPVRQDGNPGTFHHKVFVIDGQTLVTGSLNFSENADDSNDENVLVITNPEIAAQYLQEFERRWAEAEAPDPADFDCR